jgi:predicted nucleotidyltransferase
MLQVELRKLLPVYVVVDIEEFTESVKSIYPDAKIYLYGSFAKYPSRRDSDVDLIVVSNCFEKIDYWSRYSFLRRFASERRSFEILAYTPRELEVVLERNIVIKDASIYWVEVAH